MIEITINGNKVKTEEGKTVLEAALEAGMYIPNICYHPDLEPIASCRLCVVEIEGMRGYPTACTVKVSDGMKISADTPEVRQMRKNNIWLLLSEMPDDFDKDTQFMRVAEYIGIENQLPGHEKQLRNIPIIDDEPLYIRDMNVCILCGRCVQMCQDVRGVGAIGFKNRGIESTIGTSFSKTIQDEGCRFCCACVEVCPTGALVDKERYLKQREEAVM
ncbi:2Fe-2S iron-sulfur cluster-binding protein [Spirochaetota bacterium]